MTERDRSLYTCEYTFHGEKRLYHGYFFDVQDAWAFGADMEALLPCVEIHAVREQPHGLVCGGVMYRSRFLQQIQVYLTGVKYLPHTFRFALMPVPLKQSHRETFLQSLRQSLPCEVCGHVLRRQADIATVPLPVVKRKPA